MLNNLETVTFLLEGEQELNRLNDFQNEIRNKL